MKSINQTLLREISISYRKGKKLLNPPKISTSGEAHTQLIPCFDKNTISIQEQFVVMYLDHGNHVIGTFHASKGGITGTVVDMRLILSIALKVLATKIILAHNHPSGNLTPSKADLAITEKLKSLATLFDILVLDHFIIGADDKFLSFADEGYL